MKQNPAFVLVGAGSTIFTPGLLRDLATNPRFNDFTIRLVDVDPEAAETMAALGRRIAERVDSGMRVEAYAERRDALVDALFVTTTIAVGSVTSRRRDFDIPARYGIEQTVGDTVGPGGILRALRHIPELVAIAEDIADLAPQSWLMNYANPLTANVRAVLKHTDVRTIGLCHGTMHTKATLAVDLELDPEDVHTVFAGLNHLCWLLDIRSGGVDLYPRLRELVREKRGGRDAPSNRLEGVHSPVSADLLETYGLYPAPGDRHVAEFFGGYLKRASSGELEWGLQGGQDKAFENMSGKSDLWDKIREQAYGSADVDVSSNTESERLATIASALLGGKDYVEMAINLPNDGKIRNLPPTAVVEVPAVVGISGVTGLAVGPLPEAIAAVLTARANQQEIIVQAAVSGDRQLALQALALDPLVPNSATARSILDDAIVADPVTLQRFAL